MTRIAILDYGMGNLRSVEKALERVGAEARITGDPDAARGCRRRHPARASAPFPRAMRRVRELGSTRWSPSGSRPACRCSASASAFSSCSSARPSSAGPTGLGLLPGEVTGLEAPGLKVPHIGWEPVRWERSSELTEGLATETPFYFVHSFAVRPRDAGDVLGTAEWGERFACAVARPPLYGVQFHPEKSSAAGPAPAGQLRRDLRLRAGVILYPAIDIRGGHAVRLVAGRLRARDRVRRRPARRRAALAGAGGARPARRRPRRRAVGRARRTSSTCARIAAEAGVPVQCRRRPARRATRWPRCWPRAPSGWCSARRRLRDPDLVAGLAAEHGERIVVARRRPRRAGRGRGLGAARPRPRVEDLVRELAGRGVRRFVYTPVEVDGTLGGPALEGLRAAAAAAAEAVPS